MGVLWDLAERAGITCFGTSASLRRRLHEGRHRAGAEPRPRAPARRRLDRLAALARRASSWVYEHVGSDTWLFSTSGGTDVCTAFVGGVPLLPVYRGELQGRALGAAVEAFDEDGNAVVDEVGELVITEPMPSMPLFLWGDEDGSRYRASYFEMYPGIWRHGDWIEITSARHGDHLRPLGLDHQPPGRAHGHQRDLPRGRRRSPEVLDALVVDVPRPGHRGLDAAVRRAARGRRASTTS